MVFSILSSKNFFLISLSIILSSTIQTATSHSQCTQNAPKLNPGYGKGTVVDDLGGLKTYISGSFDYHKPAILLVSDVFGFEAPILRALADKVAESEFYVVVPDFFYGDPFTNISIRSTWSQNHTTDLRMQKHVIQALKEKGVSAIGAAGFCWGGKVVVELAKSDAIKAAVLLHPSTVTVDDIKKVKTPIAILGAELDTSTPPALVEQFEDVLSTKPEVPSYVKIFPGVAHGWTLQYNVTDKEAVKKAEEAHKIMLHWLIKYVK